MVLLVVNYATGMLRAIWTVCARHPGTRSRTSLPSTLWGAHHSGQAVVSSLIGFLAGLT